MPHLPRTPARVAALVTAIVLVPATVMTVSTTVTAATATTARPSATIARAPAAPRATGAAAAPAAPAPPPALLLINGDTVTMRAGGQGVMTPGGHGLAGSVLRLRVAGKSYVIPTAAVPYLGRGLSPSLFEVSLLAGRESAGRLPVELGYNGTAPQLPGVTLTHTGGGVAEGYLTPASARAFGAALVRQFAADHAKGSYGQDGLFRDGVSVSLAGTAPARAASAAPRARAGFALHTLTVAGTNLKGGNDTGDLVFVFNADNTDLFGDFNENFNFFFHGTAKFSVPAGHYWAVADYIDFSAKNKPIAERDVVLPQFSVGKDSRVRMAERAANSRVSISTPRPSVIKGTAFDLRRIPRKGSVFVFGPEEDGTFPLWVSPTTTRPTAGRLQDYTDQWRASPAGAASRYEYDLAYGATGTIPRQDFAAKRNSLATIRGRYYSDVNSRGDVVALGYFRPQFSDEIFSPNSAYDVRDPRTQTEYLTGNPAITWWQGMAQYSNVSFGLAGPSGGQWAGPKVYHAGQHLTENWDAYPLHTGVSTRDSLAFFGPGFETVTPSATRAGNTLNVQVIPFSDSNGHLGEGFENEDAAPVTSSYELDQNGKKISGGKGVSAPGKPDEIWQAFHSWQFQVSPNPSVLRFKVVAARARSRYPLSTKVSTVWTWRSAPPAGGRLPKGWQCAQRDRSRQCTPEPLMTLGYHVRGLGLDETARPGRQVLDLTAGHIQLARHSRITRAAVQFSFDNGSTWHRAQVRRRGRGRFRVVYAAPAGSQVTLRASAADAAHGQITETIVRAYRTAAHGAAAHTVSRRLCPPVRAGHMRCLVTVRTRGAQAGGTRAAAPRGGGVSAAPVSSTTPKGLGAKAIESAYRLPVSKGSRQTVAVVDAFRTPSLASYLNVYRRQYGLPPCTAANGCLRIVNQSGHATPQPASGENTGWDLETTLDVDMVSAACPHCKILLVEANSPAGKALAAGENTAARLGAQVISNSYGARETGQPVATFGRAYDHPGHTIVVSSGDSGFTAADFPADLASVTAVGGTKLARAKTSRGWRETTWAQEGAAAGSGCSAYVAKPSWQHDKACPGRTVADVSAVAFNLAVYEKFYGGWVNVGGTSAAAPLVAGVYALAGNATTIKPGYVYGHAGSLFDVTAGSSNVVGTAGPAVCGNTYLCLAKKGYDGPTGLGTPNGTGGF